MTIDHRSASATLEELLRSHTTEELLEKLAPKSADPAARLPRAMGTGAEEIAARWELLPHRESEKGVLLDAVSGATAPLYSRNIENFIGTVNPFRDGALRDLGWPSPEPHARAFRFNITLFVE